MSRREKIDWEAIRKAYCKNLLSLRELAKQYDVGVSSITRKARKEDWVRDHTEDIKSEIKNKLLAVERAQSEQHAITQAADETVAIILKHRRIVRDATNRSNVLDEKFDGVLLQIADLNDMSKAASIQKSLVEAKGKLIALERQAFNIEDERKESNDPVTLNITAV